MATTCPFVDVEAGHDGEDDAASETPSDDDATMHEEDADFVDDRPLSQLSISEEKTTTVPLPFADDMASPLAPPLPFPTDAHRHEPAAVTSALRVSQFAGAHPKKRGAASTQPAPAPGPAKRVRPEAAATTPATAIPFRCAVSDARPTAAAAAAAASPSPLREEKGPTAGPPPYGGATDVPPLPVGGKDATAAMEQEEAEEGREEDEAAWLATEAVAQQLEARQQRQPTAEAAANGTPLEMRHFNAHVHVFGFVLSPQFQHVVRLAQSIFKPFEFVELLAERVDPHTYALLWIASDNTQLPHIRWLMPAHTVDHRSRTPFTLRFKSQWFDEVRDFNRSDDAADCLLTQECIIVRNTKLFFDMPVVDMASNGCGTVSTVERAFEEEHLPECAQLGVEDVATMCSQIKRAEKVSVQFLAAQRKLLVSTETGLAKRKFAVTLSEGDMLRVAGSADWVDRVSGRGFHRQFSCKHFQPVEHCTNAIKGVGDGRIRLGLQLPNAAQGMNAFAVFVFEWGNHYRVTVPLAPREE